MQKIPNLINGMSVRYFRSINSIDLKKFDQVNIITGSNDVGKSNLIRALNLFFKETNELDNPINFQEEFSHSRLEAVRKDSIKGKQFIQVEIEFNCHSAFKNTLPEKFRVKKTWNRDTKGAPDRITNNLQNYIDKGTLKTTINKAEGSLSRFLNSIKFTYVPAIKDKLFFRSILSDLQDVLFKNAPGRDHDFMDEVRRFNNDLESQAIELRQEFKDLTGIDASLALPSSLGSLFSAFDVKTLGSFGDSVSLDSRGDGMRVRFIPAIMNYIAERSPKQHVWGFEEPENSMEYRRAFELAATMGNTYSKNAQIFVTTHSPAFIDLSRENQRIFLAKRSGANTEFLDLNNKKDLIEKTDPSLLIADELGHIALLDELRNKMQQRMDDADAAIQAQKDIIEDLKVVQKPVVLTEGSCDKIILEYAWSKLYELECPFLVKSCDVSADKANQAAGADQLGRCIRSVLPDSPHLVIGVFDRDAEGIKAWTLDHNFILDDLFSDWRMAKNGKAHALLLPVPQYEPMFEISKNLCIEFMFPPTALSKQVDGQGLVLEPMLIVQKMGSIDLEKVAGTEPWQMKVASNKTYFAEKIVPTLDQEEFSEFDPLFQKILEIIAKHEQN